MCCFTFVVAWKHSIDISIIHGPKAFADVHGKGLALGITVTLRPFCKNPRFSNMLSSFTI